MAALPPQTLTCVRLLRRPSALEIQLLPHNYFSIVPSPHSLSDLHPPSFLVFSRAKCDGLKSAPCLKIHVGVLTPKYLRMWSDSETQVFTEVMRLEWSRQGESAPMTGVLIKRRNLAAETHVEERQYEGPRGKTSQGERLQTSLSAGVSPADTLILDFKPLELWDNKFLLLEPLYLWYFVIASLPN